MRGARPSTDRPIRLTTALPESVSAQLSLHLFSPVEGRVPKGAYQSFLIERIKEYFDWDRLDLHPYGLPPGYFVAGPKAMIRLLQQKLEGDSLT